MVFYVNNTEIQMQPSDRLSWNKFVSHELLKQLDGFEEKTEGTEYSIYIRDIASISIPKILKNATIVPGAYAYQYDGHKELFYDEKKKALFELNGNDLILYTDIPLRFAVPYLVNFITIKSSRKLVHAAAFSHDDKGYLFCAFGGIGKTALLAKAAESDRVKLFGDDLNFLDDEGYIYPYMRPFCIYDYHKQLFPRYFKKHPTPIKKTTFLAKVPRRIKRELGIIDLSHYDYATIAPNKLLNNDKIAAKSVRLEKIFILERQHGIKDYNMSPCENDYAVNFILSVIQSEWHGLYRSLLSYHALSGKSFETYLETYAETIRKGIKGKDLFKIVIPMDKKIDQIGEDILELIDLKG